MKQMDDESLINAYGKGNLPAFEALYARHKGATFRYFLRQSSNRSDAEDLHQELWNKIIKQAAKFKADARFTTWMYKIATNMLIDRNRHLTVVSDVIQSESHSERDAVEEAISHSKNPDADVQAIQQKNAMLQCMQKLPIVQLQTFIMREESGLSFQELANVFEVSLDAAKSRLRYAVKALKQCIELRLEARNG